MGHMGWAEHSLAAYLAGEERDEAEAEAYNQRVEDLMRDAMDDIACSDLEKRDFEPVDYIQELMVQSQDDTDDAPAQLLRKAMRSAAVTFAKGDRGPGAYHDAGALLMSALKMACYIKAEEEAKK